jgi:hypothetical protein
MNQIFSFALMFILVLGVIQFAISTTTATNSLNIFSPSEKPYGLDYSEHAKKFWQYILAIPAKDNPFNDASGEKCSTNQTSTNSSVFYLATTEGKSERTCKVPVGKGLVIPVLIVEISDKEMPGAPMEDLCKSAKEDQDKVNSLYLSIDNKVYTFDNLTKYRIHPPVPFEAIFPNDGLFGVTQGGKSKVCADGHWIITDPLTKGNHTIHFRSGLNSDPNTEEPPYAQDVTYHIIAG